MDSAPLENMLPNQQVFVLRAGAVLRDFMQTSGDGVSPVPSGLSERGTSIFRATYT